MAQLEGRPGTYDIPSRGQLITRSGLVTCPDEDVHEFEVHGFKVLSWDGPTPRPAPEPVVVHDEAVALRESLDHMKDKAEEAKTENILTSATYGTPERNNRSRVQPKKSK